MQLKKDGTQPPNPNERMKEKITREVSILDDSRNYAMRVWRTQALKKEILKQIEVMLDALTPVYFRVTVKYQTHDYFGVRYDYIAEMDSKGGDAHCQGHGSTAEGAKAHLLSNLLNDHGFFPLT